VSAPRSLRARVALAALAAVALVGVLAAALLLAGIEREGRNAVDKDLRTRAERLVQRPGEPPGPRRLEGPGSILAGSGQFAQVSYGGRLLQQQGDVPANPPAVPQQDGLDTVDIDGVKWRSLTLSSADGELRVQLLSSLASVQERVSSTRRLVVLLGLAALLATGLAAWAFTTLALRPLARLQAGAARVSRAEDLSTPLPEDEGPEEVRSLSRALNAMLGRLQASSAATRRFAADAGHELRTPLTGLRANLDALERNPDLPAADREALVRDTIAEQERILHLLEGLQALARGDAAERLPREPVELDEVLDAAVYAARRRHPEVDYEFEDRVTDATLSGWDGGLRLMADNLLDNAALHGRAGGRVRVGLERADGQLVMRVEDDGPGLAEEEREAMLAPFARGRGATAPGSGLGLAIVAQQVTLHGGALQLDGSALGGLGVEIRLPQAVQR
jgi:two-component system sensor histidine kinase PrrB